MGEDHTLPDQGRNGEISPCRVLKKNADILVARPYLHMSSIVELTGRDSEGEEES
jgi:hypothetical protein